MNPGAPYLKLAMALERFYKRTKMTPTDVWNGVRIEWKKHGQRPPSRQVFYMSRYGLRPLPLEVVLFMKERWGFEVEYEDTFPMMNLDGVRVKSNNIRLPRQSELKFKEDVA